MGLKLLVTKRNQRQHGIMHGLVAFTVVAFASLAASHSAATPTLSFNSNNSFGCLFANAFDAGNCRDIAGDDGGLEHLDTQPAKDRERQLGTHAGHVVHQEMEQIALPRRAEAVKHVRVSRTTNCVRIRTREPGWERRSKLERGIITW